MCLSTSRNLLPNTLIAGTRLWKVKRRIFLLWWQCTSWSSLFLFAFSLAFTAFLAPGASNFCGFHELQDRILLFLFHLGLVLLPLLVDFSFARLFGFLLHFQLLASGSLLQVESSQVFIFICHHFTLTPFSQPILSVFFVVSQKQFLNLSNLKMKRRYKNVSLNSKSGQNG